MSLDLAETLDILRRTPAVLSVLLRGTSASWHANTEGPDTWSAFDVVGHLIHGEETDWVPRARIILEHGDSRPFEPFDRFAQFTRFTGWPLDRLLDRFAELRQANPAVEYVPPHGRFSMDILTRLGEAFSWADLAAGSEEVKLGDVAVRVASPAMLYRMKKNTVRPQDRAEAFHLEEP